MSNRHPVPAQVKFLVREDVNRIVTAEIEADTVEWGEISGSISSQPDLVAALAAAMPLTITVTAGESLGGHRAVRIAADGKAYYGNPDATSRFTVGVTTGAAASGAPVEIQIEGEMTEGSWAWSSSEVVWLAANGVLTQTVPTSGHAFQVGVPMGPTKLRIEPEHVAKIS